MIPRIIHRLWLGPAEFPERYRGYGRRWAELNPGWKVVDWGVDEEYLPADFPNLDIWDEIGRVGVFSGTGATGEQAIAVQRADVAGYGLVWRFGGVYVNCDIEPVRPLEPWIDDVVGERAFAGYEDQRFLNNAVLGGPPGHPFWGAVVEALGPRYRSMPGAMMNQVTGPYLLTGVWQGWEGDDFLAVEREVFNPVHYSQVPAGGYVEEFDLDAHPKTISLHHWGHRLEAAT